MMPRNSIAGSLKKFYSLYSRLPHLQNLRFRVRMFRMHGPSRIIPEEDLYILPVDVMEGFWKWDCDLRFVVDEVYDISARLPGSKMGEILVYVGLRSCWPMG
jgi:hypothetical protein